MANVDILINNDNYIYIKTTSKVITKMIENCCTRKIKKFNNYTKDYEIIKNKHYKYNLKDGFKIKAGLLSYITKLFDENNIKYNIKNNRKNIINKFNDNEIVTQLNDYITLRLYQKEAVTKVFHSDGYCCLQLPTGSGKTECASSIIKTFLNKYPNYGMLYVVPTIKLKKESEERFKSYGINVNIKYPLKFNNCVNIVTYNSLVRSSKIKDIDKKLMIKAIIFDECQYLKAEKSSLIIHDFTNLYLCVGLSATLTKNIENKLDSIDDLDDNDFNIIGSIGKPVYYKSINQTIEENFVTPIKITVIQNPENIKIPQDKFNDWIYIKNNVLMSDFRSDLISEFVSYIVNKNNLNTICLLIPEVRWSQKLMKKVASMFCDNDKVKIYLTYGSDKCEEIVNGEIVKVKSHEDKEKLFENIKNPNVITIFSATSYFYEGINIVNMQAIVNVYGGKSETRIKQQAGRVMRLFSDKDYAYIYEIYDNNLILKNQLKTRLNIYKKYYNAEVIKSDFKL